MQQRSRVQRDARERILQVAASGLPVERLTAELMAAVQMVVPSEGYRLFGLDPETRLVNRLLAASENDAWARLEWLRDVYLATGSFAYIEHDRLTRLELPAVALHARQETCWGYPTEVLERLPARDHYHLFHELRCPIGGTLLANFAADGRWVAALQLYRRDPNRAFTPADVAFVRRVEPLIGRAIAIALSRERAVRTTDACPDAAGVLLLAPDHRVTLCTPAGEAWLALLHDADRTGHDPLPTAIWSAVAGLRSPERPSASTINVPTTHGTVRIEASAGGPDGSIAVVLAPVRPSEPPEIPASWPLTPQERRVANLLVRGFGNREIAAALYISENTVEWHLRHAYEKLDVHSRSQLLARFFRETYWPTLSLEASESGSEGSGE